MGSNWYGRIHNRFSILSSPIDNPFEIMDNCNKSKYSKLKISRFCRIACNLHVDPITQCTKCCMWCRSSPAWKMGCTVFCACNLQKLTLLVIRVIFLLLMYFFSIMLEKRCHELRSLNYNLENLYSIFCDPVSKQLKLHPLQEKLLDSVHSIHIIQQMFFMVTTHTPCDTCLVRHENFINLATTHHTTDSGFSRMLSAVLGKLVPYIPVDMSHE